MNVDGSLHVDRSLHVDGGITGQTIEELRQENRELRARLDAVQANFTAQVAHTHTVYKLLPPAAGGEPGG